MTSRKKILVIGGNGQDGAHLCHQLLSQGYKVYCSIRSKESNTWRLKELNIINKINLVNIDILNFEDLDVNIELIKPNIIFHVAGESFVADSFLSPDRWIKVNCIGTLNILEAIKRNSPQSKLFFASSSEIFSTNNIESKFNENSRIKPMNPYGVSKMTAQELVRMYRESYNINASIGIMFNHEGPLRARNYVTRKITFNLARLKALGGDPMALGGFNSKRDWGSAEDYTSAMINIMENDLKDDFVFSTGNLTSIRDFLSFSATEIGFEPEFEGLGIDEVCFDKKSGRKLSIISKKYYRPFDSPARVGDSSKLKKKINWNGSRSIENIAIDMIKADVSRRKKGNIYV